jgi:hypothetical protein
VAGFLSRRDLNGLIFRNPHAIAASKKYRPPNPQAGGHYKIRLETSGTYNQGHFKALVQDVIWMSQSSDFTPSLNLFILIVVALPQAKKLNFA